VASAFNIVLATTALAAINNELLFFLMEYCPPDNHPLAFSGFSLNLVS
jgi:hypothetical protein